VVARGGAHATGLGTDVVGVLNASGSITGQLPLGGRPGGVAVGAGSVWATDTTTSSLVQINPATRAIVDQLTPIGVDPTGVAVGGGGVWVANSGADTVSWSNAKTRGKVVVIRVGQGPGPIAYGLGYAWVINTTDDTLQRINPTTLQPSRPIGDLGTPSAIAVGGGAVWVTDTTSRTVLEINPNTLRVVDRFDVGDDPVAVIYAYRRVWVTNTADGTVTSIDPTTGKLSSVPVGHDPTGLSAAGMVWVLVGQPASVVRIDPRTLHTTRTLLHSLPEAIAGAADGQTWVAALAPPASHHGGTLRVVAQGSGFDDPFDPAKASTPDDWQPLSLTNDGLVTYQRVGGAGGTDVVADLATALPTVSANGLTYTFQLRRRIRYSNGRPVRASDFLYAVTRQLRRNPIGYYAGVVFSNLLGYQACVVSPATCSLAQAIQTDDTTGQITIHLAHPDPDLVTKLATVYGDLVPPGSPPPKSGKPVPATGPYMAKNASKQGFVLVRNPAFHQWSAPAQPAGYPNEIRFSFVATAQKELTDVEHGTADVMLDPPPSRRVPGLELHHPQLTHPYDNPLETNYLFLNTRLPPFNNLLARQAVNYAVDRNEVVNLIGGPLVAAPTCQVLPPGMPGYAPYCPYTANPKRIGIWSAPDRHKARQLVRASHTGGDRITILSGGFLGSGPIASYLAHVLTNIGYRASVHTAHGAAWYMADTDSGSRTQAGLAGWVADYPSPPDFLGLLLTCNAFKRNSTANLNESEFCDPQVDTLMKRAATAESSQKPNAAIALWQEADRTVVDQAPWVPLYTPVGVDVISSHVGDYQHNPFWACCSTKPG
jgi:ABC-type transport system substrate-binding protein